MPTSGAQRLTLWLLQKEVTGSIPGKITLENFSKLVLSWVFWASVPE